MELLVVDWNPRLKRKQDPWSFREFISGCPVPHPWTSVLPGKRGIAMEVGDSMFPSVPDLFGSKL
jgi:hypothetical protein